MKKDRKQWMKYVAVILSFVIMASSVIPGTRAMANATEGTEAVALAEKVPAAEVVQEEIVEPVIPESVTEVVEEPAAIVVPEEEIEAEEVVEEPAAIVVPEEVAEELTATIIPGEETENGIEEAAEEIIAEAATPEVVEGVVTTDEISDEEELIIIDTPEGSGIVLADWTVEVFYDFNGGLFPGDLGLLGDGYESVDTGLIRTMDPGTGDSIYVNISSDLKLASDWEFLGWLCNVDNKLYQSGEGITVTSGDPVTFTAQWKVVKTAMVTIDLGGGSCSEADVPAGFKLDETGSCMVGTFDNSDGNEEFTIVLPSNLEAPFMFQFSNWDCDGVYNRINEDGSYVFRWDSLEDSSEIYFTAQWGMIDIEEPEELKTVTVKYDPNGGSYDNVLEETYTQAEGETEFSVKISNDIIPKLEGSTFLGWQCNMTSDVYEIAADGSYIFLWEKLPTEGEIVFTAEWEWDKKSILTNDTYSLTPGIPYVLGAGNWTVNDDGYSYAGGSNVYVKNGGNYSFNKK